MAQVHKYNTIEARSEGFYKEKGSKFIGIIAPCYNEEQAKELLATWKKEHHQARHLCYAFRFGANHDSYRSNDDGEPSNSAGAPILGQIQSFELTNVLIGVVRYYGGTKLGVGGLINAYRTAAKEAIEHGKIIIKYLANFYALRFDYATMPHLMNYIKEQHITVNEQLFETSCYLSIQIPLPETERVLAGLEQFEHITVEHLGIH